MTEILVILRTADETTKALEGRHNTATVVLHHNLLVTKSLTNGSTQVND